MSTSTVYGAYGGYSGVPEGCVAQSADTPEASAADGRGGGAYGGYPHRPPPPSGGGYSVAGTPSAAGIGVGSTSVDVPWDLRPTEAPHRAGPDGLLHTLSSSRYVRWKVAYALRMSLIAVVPVAGLIAAEATGTKGFVSKSFATSGALITAVETFGGSVDATWAWLKAVPITIPLLTFFAYINLFDSPMAWAGAYFGTLTLCAFACDGLTKRLAMLVTTVVMVSMLRGRYDGVGKGTDVEFPIRIAVEYTIGCLTGIASTLLPWPRLASTRADKKIVSAAANLSAAFGGLCGAFWAPSNMHRRIAMVQIQFDKKKALDDLQDASAVLAVCRYEPQPVAVYYLRLAKAAMLQQLAPLVDATLRLLEAIAEDPRLVDTYQRRAAGGGSLAPRLTPRGGVRGGVGGASPATSPTSAGGANIFNNKRLSTSAAVARASTARLHSTFAAAAAVAALSPSATAHHSDRFAASAAATTAAAAGTGTSTPPPLVASEGEAFAHYLSDALAELSASVAAALSLIGNATTVSELHEEASSGSGSHKDGAGGGPSVIVSDSNPAFGPASSSYFSSSSSPFHTSRAARHPIQRVRMALAEMEATYARARREIFYNTAVREKYGLSGGTSGAPASGEAHTSEGRRSESPVPQQHGTVVPAQSLSAAVDPLASAVAGAAAAVGDVGLRQRRVTVSALGVSLEAAPTSLPPTVADAVPAPAPASALEMTADAQDYAALMSYYMFTLTQLAKRIATFPAAAQQAYGARVGAGRAAADQPLSRKETFLFWLRRWARRDVAGSATASALYVRDLIAYFIPIGFIVGGQSLAYDPQSGEVTKRAKVLVPFAQRRAAAIKLREGVKVSASCCLCMLFFYTTDRRFAFYGGPAIVAFIAANTTSEALSASLIRILGAPFGCVVGFFCARITNTPAEKVGALAVLAFVCGFFRTGKQYGAAAVYACFVIVPLMLPNMTSDEAISRIMQGTFGAIIYSLISAVFFPSKPVSELQRARSNAVLALNDHFSKVMGALIAPFPFALEAADASHSMTAVTTGGAAQEQPQHQRNGPIVLGGGGASNGEGDGDTTYGAAGLGLSAFVVETFVPVNKEAPSSSGDLLSRGGVIAEMARRDLDLRVHVRGAAGDDIWQAEEERFLDGVSGPPLIGGGEAQADGDGHTNDAPNPSLSAGGIIANGDPAPGAPRPPLLSIATPTIQQQQKKRTAKQIVCRQLPDSPMAAVQSTAAALLSAVQQAGAWMPFAEMEPTLTRVPYPTALSGEMHASVIKLRSLSDLMGEALRTIRQRMATNNGPSMGSAAAASTSGASTMPHYASPSPLFLAVIADLAPLADECARLFAIVSDMLVVSLTRRGAKLAASMVGASLAFEEACVALREAKSRGLMALVKLSRIISDEGRRAQQWREQHGNSKGSATTSAVPLALRALSGDAPAAVSPTDAATGDWALSSACVGDAAVMAHFVNGRFPGLVWEWSDEQLKALGRAMAAEVLLGGDCSPSSSPPPEGFVAARRLKLLLSNADALGMHTLTLSLVIFAKEVKRLVMSVEGLQQHMVSLH